MSIRARLLADIEKFLRVTGMSHTRFGKEVMNDASFVTRLRKGRNIGIDTAEEVWAHMGVTPEFKMSSEDTPASPSQTANI